MKTQAISRLQSVIAMDKSALVKTLKTVAKGLQKLGAGKVVDTETPVGNTGSLVIDAGSLSPSTLGAWLVKQGFKVTGTADWTKWAEDADTKVNVSHVKLKSGQSYINVFIQTGLVSYRQFLTNRSKRPQYQPPEV